MLDSFTLTITGRWMAGALKHPFVFLLLDAPDFVFKLPHQKGKDDEAPKENSGNNRVRTSSPYLTLASLVIAPPSISITSLTLLFCFVRTSLITMISREFWAGCQLAVSFFSFFLPTLSRSSAPASCRLTGSPSLFVFFIIIKPQWKLRGCQVGC